VLSGVTSFSNADQARARHSGPAAEQEAQEPADTVERRFALDARVDQRHLRDDGHRRAIVRGGDQRMTGAQRAAEERDA